MVLYLYVICIFTLLSRLSNLSHLHHRSFLFACIIFTDTPQALKSKLRVSHPWDNDEISPVLVVVLPRILVLALLDKLTWSQLPIVDDVVDRMKRELDYCDIGGSYNASQLRNDMHSAHSKIIKRINDVKELALTAAWRSPSVTENEVTKEKIIRYLPLLYGVKLHRLPKGWIYSLKWDCNLSWPCGL